MAIFNEEQVLKILNAYNPWWKNLQIPSDYLREMKRTAYYEAERIVMNESLRRFIILSGARRVGKTTILYQLIQKLIQQKVDEKNIIYLSLDNPILKFGTLDKIMEIYINNIATVGPVYIFLDEIQYASDWNNWLKVFYDQNKNWNIVATGSASPLINKGITESGVGRWITITVPTLSFYEYCRLVDDKQELDTRYLINGIKSLPEDTRKMLNQTDISDKKKSEIINEIFNNILEEQKNIERINKEIPEDFSVKNIENMKQEEFAKIINILEPMRKYFNRYLTIGGFPELALSKDDKMAQRILREDIVDKVLKRDMPELFGIRNISVLEKVFLYLCFESSNIINYSSMSQDLEGVTSPTIQDYVKYLENANLIYISEQLNVTGAKLLKGRPKIYIADSALRNAVLMKEDILTDATEMGYIVETAVYRHLYTFIQNTTGNIGYYRDIKTGKEIDVVTNSVKENMYVEVKYREDSTVKNDNPIYQKDGKNDKLFIITKNINDYSIKELENGKKVVRIPAFAYLYLLGLEEMRNIEK